ncbi:MAG: carbohydrate kinase family protein [Treponema sp.]|nr:carbohydrate kinase family protein [Treponema sp.]
MSDSRKRKILCIGNVSVDIKAYSVEEDTCEAYRDGTIDLVPGGVARGMAMNLRHLGLDSYIYSTVGDDIFGDYLRHGLEAEGVNTALLRSVQGESTSLFSVMASAGSRASCIYSTKVLRNIDFTDDVIAFIEKEQIVSLALDSNISPETFEKIYAYKKTHPELFVFQNATSPDLACRTQPYVQLIDLFACNEFEAAAILHEEPLMDITTVDKFRSLGYGDFIVTFGDRGVLVAVGKDTYIEPPYAPVRVVDTIGAGDAFASGFLMGFLEHEPVKSCIRYGLVCANETLLTRGTVCERLSRDFVLRFQGKRN